MTTKTTYLFDPVTSEYLGTYEAQESPEEPGVYLEPISSLSSPPPAIGQNQIVIASGGAWIVEDDYRGETIYEQATGAAQEIAAIGPIPAGWALTKPPSVQLLDAQKSQIAILSAACQAQIYAGFQSLALGASHTYPAKDKDQSNLTASYAASFDPTNAAGWTTPFWVMDSAGAWSFTQHTAAQIQQAGRDGKVAILSALEKNAALAAQVMSVQLSATVTIDQALAAVAAIVW